jgi:serine/threonine protein kinase
VDSILAITLDHYRIDGLVARSGMASIFRGTDLRDGRAVAIKVPHPEMEGDPIFFDRFKREEEIGKKLDHPGVVKVLNSEDRSRRYMVLEWVDGRLLRQIMNEQKKLPPERAIRITIGLCKALDYIHSQGVVHRDLKPENIMVGKDDERETHRFRHRRERRIAPPHLRQADRSHGNAGLYFSRAGERESGAMPGATFIPWASCFTKC